jgi:hypothetical protein
MLEWVRPTYDFALQYSTRLVADVPDEQMTAQPVAGRVMNHAAFLLGHIAWANDNGVAILGGQPELAAWKDRMGMGATPQADRSLYPSKAALLAALERAHGRLLEAVQAAGVEALSAPPPERMRARFPTTRTLLAGLMTAHYANHNGQLSAWRRAMGLPSVF